MDTSDLITLAHGVAKPIYPSETCQAGTVGAAILSSSGRIYTGICLDFSCSLGFCAEHAAIAEMLKHQESRISHIVAVTHEGDVWPPCGRCREMMWQLNEANKAATVILSASETIPLDALLPFR